MDSIEWWTDIELVEMLLTEESKCGDSSELSVYWTDCSIICRVINNNATFPDTTIPNIPYRQWIRVHTLLTEH